MPTVSKRLKSKLSKRGWAEAVPSTGPGLVVADIVRPRKPVTNLRDLMREIDGDRADRR